MNQDAKYRSPIRHLPFLLLLFLVNCGPTTLDDLRYEGALEMKKLTAELQKIESKEDIQKRSKRLKQHFNRIADLLVETRHFSASSPLPISPTGDALFAELARIYEIPGGQEAIEATQLDAIRHLDKRKIK